MPTTAAVRLRRPRKETPERIADENQSPLRKAYSAQNRIPRSNADWSVVRQRETRSLCTLKKVVDTASTSGTQYQPSTVPTPCAFDVDWPACCINNDSYFRVRGGPTGHQQRTQRPPLVGTSDNVQIWPICFDGKKQVYSSYQCRRRDSRAECTQQSALYVHDKIITHASSIAVAMYPYTRSSTPSIYSEHSPGLRPNRSKLTLHPLVLAREGRSRSSRGRDGP